MSHYAVSESACLFKYNSGVKRHILRAGTHSAILAAEVGEFTLLDVDVNVGVGEVGVFRCICGC